MTVIDDESRVRELLAPLATVEPVRRTSRRRNRRMIGAALVAAVLTAGGAAIAGGVNPFAGIGAADHPQTGADVLDPATAATVERMNAHRSNNQFPEGRLLPETARLVGELSSGNRFYVITTSTNALCVMIQQQAGSGGSAIGCGAPLSQTQPTTLMSIQTNQETPPLTFGVAQDDVTAVSFMAKGSEQTVPVKNNVWAYEGSSGALSSLTVHFADGSTETIGHG
jgi:hypothetical protein